LQIEHLIQGLALSPFRGQLVENLGSNEVQRLKLASKMLLDTDLLVCENILRDMDLYDIAFIIDFVRDWAQRLKRIAIIAINPPTLEILTMFGKSRSQWSLLIEFAFSGDFDLWTICFRWRI
jgi:ABC-type multidrug transport system ATPase subunit